MKKIPFSSLRVRLILLVLFAIIPALGLTLYTGLEGRQHALTNARQEALRLSRLASNEQERMIDDVRQFLHVLAQIPQMRQRDPIASSSLLAKLLEQNPQYLNIGEADSNGNIFASAVPLTRKVNIADRLYFQQALKTRKFAIGEYQTGRIHGKPSVNFGYPVLNQTGAVKAIVFASFDLAWLNKFMDQIQIPKGTTLFVIDRNGMILTCYPEPEKWIGKTMPEASLVKTILSQDEGISESADLDGISRLYAFTSFGTKPKQVGTMYISIGIPSSVVFAQVNRILIRNIIFLGFIALMAIFAALFFGDLLVARQTDLLLNATKRLSVGDLNVRTGLPKGKGELNQLAQAFDEMSESLGQREAERRQAEEALRTEKQRFQALSEHAPFGIVMIDQDGTFKYLNPKFRELFRYELNDVPDGKTWFKKAYPNPIYRHDVISTWINDLRSVEPGEKIHRTFTINCKDGTEKVVHFMPVVLETGEILLACEDITDRLQAEGAVRESERKFRDLYDNAPLGYHEYDTEGRITNVNRTDVEMLGYTREEMIGLPIWKLNMNEETVREQVMAKLAGTLPPGKELERIYRRKDGTTLPVLIEDRIILDKKGCIKGIRCTIQDITGTKKVEEALQRSEEEATRLAQESATMAEIGQIINSTLNIDDVYERFADKVRELIPFDRIAINSIDSRDNTITISYFTGLDGPDRLEGTAIPSVGTLAGEVVRTRTNMLIQTEDLKKATDDFPWFLSAFHAGIRSLIAIPLISKNDVIGVLHIHSTKPNAYGEKDLRLAERVANQIAGAIANARLFAERKRAEEALRKSEAKFKYLFDNAPLGYIALDTEGRITEVNRTQLAMLCYTAEEMIGQPVWKFIVEEEKARQTLTTKLSGSAQPGKALERTYKRKDGKTLPVLIDDAFLRNAEGNVIGIHSIIQDITERKQAEEEKAALQEQLRQSQKMEAIGQLAGGIAHDFNNLLTVIKGYSQLSLFELKEGDPLRENIEEIQKASQRAVDLTRQLLAFSRRQILDFKVLDLDMLLQDLDKLLRRVLGEDIELIYTLSGDLGKVKTDPRQIEQVILNLALNARDAMPSGGKLIIETANVELDKTYASTHIGVTPGHYIRVSVNDTGYGMSPDVKDHIFEPFFTTKEKGKGTGLGLSTVYGIVKQSGGYIWVDSEPGCGTTFKIYLPTVEEEASAFHQTNDTSLLPCGSETILIAEDEPSVRGLAVRALRERGYTLIEAANGEEAFHIAQEQDDKRINLLLTDVVMPQMGGKQLADQLKMLQPDIKVLFISGYADNAIGDHGVLEPGTNFLQKPFTPTALAQRVRQVLDS
jgi:two-component system cell cycle sensor histidine kinase/response regulator CckA